MQPMSPPKRPPAALSGTPPILVGSPRLNRTVGFSSHNNIVRTAILCVVGALSLIVFFKRGGEWLPSLSSSERVAVSSGAMAAGSGRPSSSSSSHELAMEESNGFFDDIPEEEWERLRNIAHDMQPNAKGDPSDASVGPFAWYQENYEPEFSCRHEQRVGRKGDGGKWVCDPHRIELKGGGDCLVYSVGSSGDASFEAAILDDISSGCEIHVFDFGDFAQTVADQTGHSPNVHYHQWGLSSRTEGRYKSFTDTLSELGHVNRTIDVFKIDCEGCELDTYQAWLEAPVKLQQILVEIHKHGAVDMFQSLHDAGYAIFHKEPNIQYQIGNICVEYCFVLLSPKFWTTE
ncbi:hypothetical protein ACHAW5_005756 [Stephanodiscus triporus]|uniref:Methyltransferase domain-containing protein n=1 Tax=Stephanodiscus triporus TaxID=2934178 RepID=A0ABD3NWQ4_9STRA